MTRILSALLLALAAVTTTALAAGDKLKVVYHVADEEKVGFALANIRNHIEGVGGADKVEIVLVAHGPAVKGFADLGALEGVRAAVAGLADQGVQFQACANTLKVFGMAPDDLLPAFTIADQGGVVRIAELQSQGYLYIRP